MFDRAKFEQGAALFNAGEFFAAHEALEDVWREMRGGNRDFLQAVIQVAVALHHYSTGNLAGARSVLARAAATLENAPDQFLGINIPRLRQDLRGWQQALADGSPAPPPPRL